MVNTTNGEESTVSSREVFATTLAWGFAVLLATILSRY